MKLNKKRMPYLEYPTSSSFLIFRTSSNIRTFYSALISLHTLSIHILNKNTQNYIYERRKLFKKIFVLILDEIDGAPLPTVELLVRWCTATAIEGKGKSKTKTQPLKRPIIAICNDLYATSLRPLR